MLETAQLTKTEHRPNYRKSWVPCRRASITADFEAVSLLLVLWLGFGSNKLTFILENSVLVLITGFLFKFAFSVLSLACSSSSVAVPLSWPPDI